MARLAIRFAAVSPRVSVESIEAGSFPELSNEKGVRAVQHTVINDKEQIVGAVPERVLLEGLKKATA